MNKGITLLILGVLLCSMGFVFYSHLGSAPETPPLEVAAQSGATTDDIVITPRLPEEAVPTVVSGSERTGSTPTTVTGTSATPGIPSIDAVPQPSGETAQRQPAEVPPVAESTPPQTVPEIPALTPQPSYGAPTLRPIEGGINAGTQAAERQDPQGSQASGRTPAGTAPAVPPERQPVQQASNTPPQSEPSPTLPVRAALTPLDKLPKDGRHSLTEMGLHFKGNTIFLRIEAGTAFPFKTFSLSGPDRLVVDLLGTWQGVAAPSVPSNQVVTNIRVGQQKTGPRIVLDLSRKVAPKIVRVSDTVVEIVLE